MATARSMTVIIVPTLCELYLIGLASFLCESFPLLSPLTVVRDRLHCVVRIPSDSISLSKFKVGQYSFISFAHAAESAPFCTPAHTVRPEDCETATPGGHNSANIPRPRNRRG